ncbi:MAG: dTDP-4-dehydrorhamnose 3,5-epimerase [Pseudomonadota bacterium]
MKVLPTQIPGVMLFEPVLHGDDRGFFMETWNHARYSDVGLPTMFRQNNLSKSAQGVLRGLHFQEPNPQGKLVHVLSGEVFDVAVDIRRGSPTFGQWEGYHLSGDNHRQLYVPEGFAHGFCVLSEFAIFSYQCTRVYEPANDRSLAWDDPDIGISWPVDQPLLSDKDRNAPKLADCNTLPAYDEHEHAASV